MIRVHDVSRDVIDRAGPAPEDYAALMGVVAATDVAWVPSCQWGRRSCPFPLPLTFLRVVPDILGWR